MANTEPVCVVRQGKATRDRRRAEHGIARPLDVKGRLVAPDGTEERIRKNAAHLLRTNARKGTRISNSIPNIIQFFITIKSDTLRPDFNML
jgi:hypothetical protein